MPVILTLDVDNAEPGEYNRIQSLFERLGWEALGGTAYRYPKLGAEQPTEDWFNHVLPGLMLVRSYLLKKGRHLKRFTLDTNSSTGMNPAETFGTPPRKGANVQLYQPDVYVHFGEGQLRTWLDAVTDAYPY